MTSMLIDFFFYGLKSAFYIKIDTPMIFLIYSQFQSASQGFGFVH